MGEMVCFEVCFCGLRWQAREVREIFLAGVQPSRGKSRRGLTTIRDVNDQVILALAKEILFVHSNYDVSKAIVLFARLRSCTHIFQMLTVHIPTCQQSNHPPSLAMHPFGPEADADADADNQNPSHQHASRYALSALRFKPFPSLPSNPCIPSWLRHGPRATYGIIQIQSESIISNPKAFKVNCSPYTPNPLLSNTSTSRIVQQKPRPCPSFI